ncbi:MAG: IS607 family transposase [Coleofasciculus chthonoplastes F3-SA18-01]|jgi:excisionase family DNA binding protein|uniref:IS607 family transposase n=1 Tax=Coleofasciculus TaxID=669368 RepID=UPI0032FA0791
MDIIQDVPTVSIGEAAKEVGVSVITIRRWAQAGKLPYELSPSGRYRFKLSDLKTVRPRTAPGDRITINYARVSSHDQREDLVRQVQMLESYSAANGWQYETIQDLGSGLNYQKKGLQKLLKRIMSGEVDRLVLTHKDRLLRFGSELVFAVCEECETEVVVINKTNAEVNFEQELVEDVLEIITVFSARLYGKRSNKNKRLIDGIKQVADEVK